jgi:MFS family permease
VSLEVTKSGSFTRLVWSNLAAQAAEQIGLSAALLVAVLVFSAGPGSVGALQAAQTLPFLLVAIPFGVLADRMSRPRLMAAAETLRVASFALVLVLLGTGTLTLPWLQCSASSARAGRWPTASPRRRSFPRLCPR